MSAAMKEPRQPAYRVEQEKSQFMGRPVFAVRTRGGIPLAKFYGEPLLRNAEAFARQLNESAEKGMKPTLVEPSPPALSFHAPDPTQQPRASVRSVWLAVRNSMRQACGHNSLQARLMEQAADDTARMAEALKRAHEALRGVATPHAKLSRKNIEDALCAYWGRL